MPITFDLLPAVRAHLTETAQALYNRDEAAAQRCIAQVSALSPETEKMIYRKIWELAGRPTHESHPQTAHRHYGRVAFWNREGRSAPIEQKIRAVESVIGRVVDEVLAHREIVPISTPEGAERVQHNRFYDAGFDPRFSEDGTFYQRNPPRPLSELFTVIQEIFAKLLFTLKAHLSFDSEERNGRQAILSCQKLEKELSDYSYCAHMTFDGFPKVGYAEYAFFEGISDLFKAAFPNENHPKRLFPSEVLHGIHAINKPQMNSWSSEWAAPFPWENGDLDRSASWGLYRLCSYYSRHPDTDRFVHTYIPHYLFIHAIKESSAELKIAIRELRMALAEIPNDMNSAVSFQECKVKIAPKLEQIKQCWDRYTQSHELLTEVQTVFSQIDPYAKMHAVSYWESCIPSFLMNTYRQFCFSIYGKSHHFSDKASREGRDSLKQAYRGPFRETLTGRVVAAHPTRANP